MRAKLIGLAAICLMGVGCESYAPAPPPLAAIDAEIEAVADPGEIIVLARTADAAQAVLATAEERGYRVKSREWLRGLSLELIVLAAPEGVSPRAAIRILEASAPGVSAGVNHAYQGGPEAAVDIGSRRYADALLGWPASGCPASVKRIGVIDAEIDRREPALAGAEIIVRDFASGGARSAHGSITAAVLAGPGRLTGATIYNAAVIETSVNGTTQASVDQIVRALDWLRAEDVRLVNVSLEGPYNRILERSVQRATALGMIIVASAGNPGPAAPARYPAAFNDVIAVTAVDVELSAHPRAARGPHIDLAAPGTDVFIPLAPRGRYISGTSVAAPFVTALLAALPPGSLASPERARARLAALAVDLGPKGRDDIFGYGLPRLTEGCP